MAIGLVGEKRGMTRVFTEDGRSVPVTVIEVKNNRVVRVKDVDSDGYDAVQVTWGDKRASLVSKPKGGEFAKAGLKPGGGLAEFRVELNDVEGLEPGSVLSVDRFSEGQVVDVQGVSKGKGFAGAVKRWHFQMQDATHGNSVSHRAPGSTGQNQSPGRVFPGKKMAGHLGSVRRTQQKLHVVRVDLERGLLLIKGSVPGAPGGQVIVRPSIKVTRKQ
ncbi:MAG: 50S ribosomal protein L3 [Gammaproteobacteria bacterium]|nr:MAG: 50S ribosomal protein L3 [Gammaproteobacteria bacterium]